MKKIIYLVILSFGLFISSCKKSYLDINENPNDPTEESITPDLILPQALNTTATNAGAGYASFARWMGYWSRGGDYGASNEEESYDITTSFGAAGWASWYNNLYDYDVIERKANASGQKFYEGIAKTMKVFGFMYLVDTYNNVPYSRAFKIDTDILPAYDKGSDIYKDLFVQLDKALVLIDADAGASVKLDNADIMFGGSAAQWKKFINTLRLKMVLRVFNAPTAIITPSAELAKVTSEGYLGTGETAQVQPGYKKAQNKDKISQQNPFWDAYKADVNGVANDKYNRANNYVLGILKANGDPRLEYFFDKAATPISGNSYAGSSFGFIETNPNGPKSPNQSGVGGPGLAKSFSQPQWMLTSVESLFLQAEAAFRNYPTTSNTKALYDSAVRESFKFLGVPNAATAATTYLTNIAPYTPAGGLKTIFKEKYISLIGINNFEAWTDYRRINTKDGVGDYPNIPKSLSPNVGSRHIPIRLRYPLNEYNYNPANVALENNPDPQTSPIFWDAN